jgi:hypothetical protein
LTLLLSRRFTVGIDRLFLRISVLRTLSEATIEPKGAIAWLLFGIVVFIVIAPSVDLEPTVLRAVHLADLTPLLIVATCVSMALASLMRQFVGRASLYAWEADSRYGDLVILVCTLRC